MNTYEFYTNATDSARKGYDKTTPVGASFKAFQKFAQTVNTALCNDRAKLEQDKKDASRTYSQTVALGKIADLESVFSTNASAKKEQLHNILDRLVSNNRKAIEKYTTTPPTEKQIRLLDSVSRRAASISDTEWNLLVQEFADNYQASALLRDVAEKNNKSYALPFNPEDTLSRLDALNTRLGNIIDNIDREPLSVGYDSAEFLSSDDSGSGVLASLCAEFDSSSPSYTPESQVDLTDPDELLARIEQARHLAYINKNNALFTDAIHTKLQIEEHGLTEENIFHAEQLVSYVDTLYGEEG